MRSSVTGGFGLMAALTLCIGAIALASGALAQTPGASPLQPPAGSPVPPAKPTITSTRPPSPNATVNLVNLLVKQGILTEEQAAGLIKQAEEEALVAREAVKGAATKADSAEKAATAASNAVAPPGAKHVTYVPEVVKRQLREEVRQEVMDKAKKEGWVAPNTLPDWATRLRFSGDVRVRAQRDLYPPGNANNGSLLNYNAINTGNPVDINLIQNGILPPVRDVDQNRTLFRLRARLAMDADLTDGFSAGIRIATGDNSAPISTNQTLGGGGGNFSKYPVWLDRGFLAYQNPTGNFNAMVGRFNNPFFTPNDLVWADDLGFDGAAVQAKGEIAPGIVPFLVAGAFALYNSPLNFPNNGTGTAVASLPLGSNLGSEDRYLFGVQAGVGLYHDDVSAQLAASFYGFENVQGQLSLPCLATTASDSCSSDLLRPSFAQFGNTYMLLRNIVPNLANTQFQFFGLASQFQVLELTGQVDLAYFKPTHIILDGTVIDNVAFNKTAVGTIAVNNLAGTPTGAVGPFDGGNLGAMGRLTVGYPVVDHAWAWNAFVAYKYLQSDATLDAFTDSDFGLGGTNLKGYIVGARMGLSQNVWATAKWMSANSIAGPPYAVDVFQLDLQGKF
jgi:hypothetical protein